MHWYALFFKGAGLFWLRLFLSLALPLSICLSLSLSLLSPAGYLDLLLPTSPYYFKTALRFGSQSWSSQSSLTVVLWHSVTLPSVDWLSSWMWNSCSSSVLSFFFCVMWTFLQQISDFIFACSQSDMCSSSLRSEARSLAPVWPCVCRSLYSVLHVGSQQSLPWLLLHQETSRTMSLAVGLPSCLSVLVCSMEMFTLLFSATMSFQTSVYLLFNCYNVISARWSGKQKMWICDLFLIEYINVLWIHYPCHWSHYFFSIEFNLLLFCLSIWRCSVLSPL